ncbi:periplasmic heavy metal sensor [Pseudenhygromyxa sp. WMMC2535]|uniref:Spy/CpxP family protein refolding chaperone n=1 Tax=Pseudenhygromyxa sp. WMMC2535 TaxID=2712867 RepID=UPI0015555441|nr:periplasmic heavy metal sensor [Pseudenhygromyxa sp. WMMC2535]NVB40761.1 periplasmic heavy metal sensor [Pseudenhygromyxa sp. WMMC2535]
MSKQLPRRRTTLLASFAGVALAATLLVPGLAKADPGKGADAQAERICEEASCTSTQRKQVKNIFDDLHDDVKPHRNAIEKLRKQIANEWAKSSPSKSKLRNYADKIANHERDIGRERVEAMMKLHNVLNASQRKKVADDVMQGHGHKGDKHGNDSPNSNKAKPNGSTNKAKPNK